MSIYNIIAQNPDSTVIAEYIPSDRGAQHYQSEKELESEFIRILRANGYEYLTIRNNVDLLANLRAQLAHLNNVNFTDSEWEQIHDNYLADRNDSIKEKTTKVQENYIYNLKRDDGATKNIRVIDKENIHNNTLQVINQYETEGVRHNRYDVTILVNGLPLVHIELKRRGVAIREAFNQISRYQRDSFWADSGLFEYTQLFVISNGTHTKYYSNTTRDTHVQKNTGKSTGKKTGNSFEFTSWWTDSKNKRIPDLIDFAKTFLTKHSLLSILTRYCVFTTDKLLLVMRPYQIAAAERILEKIIMATNHKQLGTIDAGGYIWHTTGSGKTLTSFKTAQLASHLEYIDKVLFVVDRKDLDYQTMKEYDKFAKGAANSNTSTTILAEQLTNTKAKIIITTIQKLSKFTAGNRRHAIFDKHIVLIFDECHRSQFGEMHAKITKTFNNYHIFGFTGTPIFAVNAGSNYRLTKTTEQAFGRQLHAYTIVDAINDENVLPFRIDYIKTFKMRDDIKDKKVYAINTKTVTHSPERIALIVDYILEHFDQKTKRSECYRVEDKRLRGFNAIFAVSDIDTAKKYYTEFQSRESKLKIAIIYSFSANESEDCDGALPDEDFDTSALDQSSRDFLDRAIADYNKIFSTNYDTSSDKFENYHKDLSQRVKNREVDLLIVVNMFLTGFDATTLNTLWVDKNLRHHGLLQAFSRTNRILNSVKTFGNIVCFRDLEQATNDALSIFGNKEAKGIILLRSYNDYYNGWDNEEGTRQRGYVELIEELRHIFPLSASIKNEQPEKDFIKLWGAILRLHNILSSFDEFKGNEILLELEFQDYQSIYLDLYDKLQKHKNREKESIYDDIVFEIELIKQVTINIDFILQMVAKYHKSQMKDREILKTIEKAINSNIELRSKKELIQRFINALNANTDIDRDWRVFTDKSKTEEMEQIIEEENLKPKEARKFISDAFRNGELKSTGTAFAGILPPTSMFDKNNTGAKKKAQVLDRLRMFFEKYFGI